MENLCLTIKRGDDIKVVNASTFDLTFGTIDKLMGLLDIDEDTSNFAMLKKITTVWKEITKILEDVFPAMEPEDWEYVKMNDLVPVVLQVVRYTFAEIMGVPSDSKN